MISSHADDDKQMINNWAALIETKEIFFSKNHEENEAGGLVPDLVLLFRKALYEVKASGLQLNFIIFW